MLVLVAWQSIYRSLALVKRAIFLGNFGDWKFADLSEEKSKSQK